MKAIAIAGLMFGCAPQQGSVLDPARIEFRERALGMFRWAPTARPVAVETPKPPPQAPPKAAEPPHVAAHVFAPQDVTRRSMLAADWSAHAGPGITYVAAFGSGARGLIAYGDACSDTWIDINVAPIWRALQQHGFLAVHCQGAVERFSWPRRH